jgi:hypothetical protein
VGDKLTDFNGKVLPLAAYETPVEGWESLTANFLGPTCLKVRNDSFDVISKINPLT